MRNRPAGVCGGGTIVSSRGERSHHIQFVYHPPPLSVCSVISSSQKCVAGSSVEDFRCTSACGRASVQSLSRVPIYALMGKNSKTNICYHVLL